MARAQGGTEASGHLGAARVAAAALDLGARVGVGETQLCLRGEMGGAGLVWIVGATATACAPTAACAAAHRRPPPRNA
eukprot:scaffold73056_cov60-Phaeocystis_antarctica.AAC.1